MMKQLILLVIVMALFVLVVDNERTTIQVMIVIPPELVPYYEWMLSFPGWERMQNELPEKQSSRVTGL